MIHFPHTIIIKQIIHLINLCLDYHMNSIDGDLENETCQIKEVCDVRSLAEGRNGQLLRDW